MIYENESGMSDCEADVNPKASLGGYSCMRMGCLRHISIFFLIFFLKNIKKEHKHNHLYLLYKYNQSSVLNFESFISFTHHDPTT